MLASMTEVMAYANEHKCAIGAFNTPDIANLRAVIDAAEELNVPTIIMHAQVHEPFAPIDYVAPAMLAAAKKAKVPVCMHLDHGEDVEYCKHGIDLGFNSIMFDGSTLPYEENVACTKAVVAYAKQHGACVEGEIGAMGKREMGNGEDAGDAETVYTDPDLAKRYVDETGVDILACSFGTAHGLYLKAPQLNYDVLAAITERIDAPIVMHGGSGVSNDDYRKVIAAGVRKINYFTYMSKAGGEALRAYVQERADGRPVYTYEAAERVYEPLKEHIKGAMKVFLGMDK